MCCLLMSQVRDVLEDVRREALRRFPPPPYSPLQPHGHAHLPHTAPPGALGGGGRASLPGRRGGAVPVLVRRFMRRGYDDWLE